jgi:putative phosphoesterase
MITKILVVSDTHGRRDTLQQCIDISSPFDIIIHCGDGIRDIRGADIPEKCVILAVAGNTDIYSSPDEETAIIESIEDKKVLITHGHLYNVKAGLFTLSKYAVEIKADVVFFGHTHKSYLDMNNPVLFNPGDLSTGSYGIITIRNNKEWIFEQKSII